MIGIYKITNKVNGKVYVGQSKSIETRWRNHISDLNKKKHHCMRLQLDYDELTIKEFTFEILEICDEETDLNKIEEFYIEKYKDNIYNSKRANTKKKDNVANHLAIIPNSLIRFNFINSQRLFLMIVKKLYNTNSLYAEVTVKEFCKTFNSKGNSIYDRWRSVCDDVSKIEINNTKVFSDFYIDGSVFCVNLSSLGYDYLLGKNTSKIKGIKYDDLFKFKFTKTLSLLILILNNQANNISIDRFKEVLSINGNYESYAELKRNVINKIVNELSSIGLSVTLNEERRGSSIRTLSFYISK